MEKKRNTEFRTLKEAGPRYTVSRDGGVRKDGVETYSMGNIPLLDGTKISVQEFIHRAFPDIPLRYAHLFKKKDS